MNIEAMSHYASLKFSICNKFDIYVEGNMLNVEGKFENKGAVVFLLRPSHPKHSNVHHRCYFQSFSFALHVIRPDLSSLPCKQAIVQTYCTTTDRGGR